MGVWEWGSVGDGGAAGCEGEGSARGDAGSPSPTPPHTGVEVRGVDSHTAGSAPRGWRLVDSGAAPRPGAENMAIDHALAESVQAGGPAALRFYCWDPPCLSLGRNQPAAGVYDRAAAAARGVDIVRRPTGGRAVLHWHELTYAVAVPVGQLGSPRETYAAINRALVAGLRRLGGPALVVPERAAPAPGAAAAGPNDPAWQRALAAHPTSKLNEMPCFDLAAPGEVVAAGRKLIGSAQRREGAVLLQHGSLLLDDDQGAVLELLATGPAPAGLPVLAAHAAGAASPVGMAAELAVLAERAARPATLRELLGELPARAQLERALAEGFQEVLGIALAPAALSAAERESVVRWSAHFRSAEWTWRR